MLRALALVTVTVVISLAHPALAVDAAPAAAAADRTAGTAAADPGPSSPAADAAIDPDLLATRETAWRAWFAGNSAVLEAMLPSEFLGYGMRGNQLSERSDTLTASRGFAASGGRLARLAFPETRAQRYGDVVVLYSLYELELVDGAGKASTMSGRATEVFVRRDGKWLHPGWHLDLESSGS